MPLDRGDGVGKGERCNAIVLFAKPGSVSNSHQFLSKPKGDKPRKFTGKSLKPNMHKRSQADYSLSCMCKTLWKYPGIFPRFCLGRSLTENSPTLYRRTVPSHSPDKHRAFFSKMFGSYPSNSSDRQRVVCAGVNLRGHHWDRA